MAVTLNLRAGREIVALLACLVFVTAGCGQADHIETYPVPKETKPAPVADASHAKAGEPTDRMLAAVLPTGGQAWFFKVVGPIAEVDKQEKAINDFFSHLSLGDDGHAHWIVPEGWKEEPGNGIRQATIVIPNAKEKPLEITVTAANWSGTQKDELANVNRWRGQLQLPPVGPMQLADVMHEVKAGDRTITIVDMKGRFKSGGMTPPFAGGTFGPRATGSRSSELPPGHPPIDDLNGDLSSGLPAGHPPIGDANGGLPAGHPPIDNTAEPVAGPSAQETSPDEVPKFQAPSSWKPLPANEFDKAQFAITDGEQQAQVKLVDFPINEGPMIADPLLNINRWRREVGLPEIQKDALPSVTKDMKVGGKPAIFAAMIPDAAKPEQAKNEQATLAAIVKNGDRIWFIKMIGSRNLVATRQDEFTTFLKSIQFPHHGHEKHGETKDGNK
ncbi:MAG TPA: hypothetical protein VHE81_06750 [Lacipirellulaceae bacterium]|nr:hypothetical protein [Lacipirellulaceae bacterium]